ncbi:MAG: VOC family protein [Prolixibacteraceae bacterium]|nr:VOC family protein [Prolixibacteraceae bacterium]
MKNQITPCLWFDNQAETAAKFYTSLFEDSKIGPISRYGKEGFEVHGQTEGTAMTVAFQIGGQSFTALNGGPYFKINPSISFYVVCETEKEIDLLWEQLSEGGTLLMPLEKYDWSEKYGWLNDRFGLSWQISLGKFSDTGRKFSPAFLFMGPKHTLAEEAVHFYTSVFPDSGIKGILKYASGENEPEGTVKHAQFQLQNQTFMIMGNSMTPEFDFNEAISFQVSCDTQDEIDYYWNKLSEGGSEGQCGWLKDKYGVSWQIIPSILDELINNPEKAGNVTRAFLQMKKFDIAKLLQA